jgi:DNA-binding transcriptional regulator YiaG
MEKGGMTMSVIERMTLLDSILKELANDTLSIHQAIRRLRVEVTGLNQARFARMCKISVRALVQMEHGAWRRESNVEITK